MKEKTKRKLVPLVFVAPFLILFAVFMIYPFIYSIVLSLGNLRGGEYIFKGIDNFKTVLADQNFRKAIVNTFIILIIQVPIQTILCVVFASFLNMQRLKAKGLYRMLVFMPVLIDSVSYSVVFKLLFSNNADGIINSVFGIVGLGPFQWFNDPWLAKFMIIFAVTWRWTGYNTVIILGGCRTSAPTCMRLPPLTEPAE